MKPSHVVLVAFLWAAPAFASQPTNPTIPTGFSEQTLVQLSSDKNANIYYLGLLIDSQGKAAGMFNNSDPSDVPDPSINGDAIFTLAQIESPDGVVLATAEQRSALLLKGTVDPAPQSGRFTVEYLENGLLMTYASCDFLLNFQNGAWNVTNAYTNQAVKAIKVDTTLLGISTIEGICP